jgi:hypothetical protein
MVLDINYDLISPKISLLMVVFTQKSLCNIIPNTINIKNTYKKFELVDFEIIYAAIMVRIRSTRAILKIPIE